MTMKVKGPGGVTVEFPDGTPPETIDQVMREATQAIPQQQAEPEIVHRGSILPIDRDAEGGLHLNWDSGLTGAVRSAFSLPGDIYSGRVPAMVPDTGEGTTNPEVVARANELGSFAIPGTLGGKGIARASRGAPVRAPSREALKAAGAAGYDQVRQMGVDYHANAVAGLADEVAGVLQADGFDLDNASHTFGILRDLRAIPETGPGETSLVPLSEVIRARRRIQNIPRGEEYAADREAGRRLTEALDQFTEQPSAEAVLRGPAAEAGALQREANQNYAAYRRSRRLNAAQESADLNAAVANSGQNIDNTLRRKAGWIVDPEHPHRRRGFSDEEVALLEEVAKGTPSRNALRYVGNLFGGGGGMYGGIVAGSSGSVAGTALYAGRPLLAGAALLPPIIGVTSKKAGNALTRRAFNRADEAVRMRSPLYGTMADRPMVTGNAPMSEAMLRMMMQSSPPRIYLNAGERDRMMERSL